MSDPTQRPSAGRGVAIIQRLKEKRAREAAAALASGVAELSVAETPQEVGASAAPDRSAGAENVAPTGVAPEIPKPVTVQPKEPVVRMGKAGQAIDVAANYVNMRLQDGRSLYEYCVTMDPPVDEIKSRYGKLNTLVEVTGRAKMFDGSRMLLPKRLPEDQMTFTVEDTTITITFRDAKDLSDPQGLRLCNKILNQVFKALQLVSMRTSNVDKCFYNPNDKKVLPKHKIEIWPGYVFTVEEYEGGVYLQIDTSSKIVRTQTVLNVLTEYAKKNPSTYRNVATQDLIGRSLITRYNNKTYKLDEIEFDSSPSDCFTQANGEKISYVEYYKRHYDLTIEDLKQPLLIHNSKRPGNEESIRICLIPELCYVTGMSDAMRSDFRVMNDVGAFTRLVPQTREEIISKLLESIRGNSVAMGLLDTWGVKLDDGVVRTTARRINPECLYFGDGYREMVGPKGDWSRAATTKKVLTSVPIASWAIIFPASMESDAKKFCTTLAEQGPRLGIQVARPRVVPITSDRTEAYLNAMRELPGNIDIVVTVFTGGQRSDRYAAVKKFCYVEHPMASQVLLQKTISNERRLISVVQKVALQINCKMGGELWATKIPIEGLMVVGIDVFKDKAGKSGRMLAGIVSSLTPAHTKFYSQVTFQEPGKDFKESIIDALRISAKKFTEATGKPPRHMVVYRDGVNAGMLEAAHIEAMAIDSAFRSTPTYESMTVTVAIVQKRHNTRFFHIQGRTMANPMAGTILDHNVTRRFWYDFYLVPMAVNLGTVTPTHFTVVMDTSSFSPDEFQRLSYAMTFMYYNWSGNVKVPAHCQYGHKLVELVGEHLHRPHHESLSDRLFYL